MLQLPGVLQEHHWMDAGAWQVKAVCLRQPPDSIGAHVVAFPMAVRAAVLQLPAIQLGVQH